MKTPNADLVSSQGASKEKKQLVVLGVLLAVLAVVLGAQFSAAEDGVAEAQPALAEAVTGLEGSVDRINEGRDLLTEVPDNQALSDTTQDQGVTKSPFQSFWNTAQPIETTVEEIPAPSITLNGTITSGRRPVAIIDGQTKFIGDQIAGWRLKDIGSREVKLESPTKAVVTVAMPLLQVKNRRNP